MKLEVLQLEVRSHEVRNFLRNDELEVGSEKC